MSHSYFRAAPDPVKTPRQKNSFAQKNPAHGIKNAVTA